MFTPAEPPYTAAQQDASFVVPAAKDVWGKVPPPPGFTVPWRHAVPSTGFQKPFTLTGSPPIPSDRQREYLKMAFPVAAPSGETFTSLHRNRAFHQLPPRAFFTAPPSPRRTHGPVFQIPAPAFHRPISPTAQHMREPSHLWSVGGRQTSTSHVVASADSSHIEGEGAHGGTSSQSMLEAGDLYPIARLTAATFPVAGRLGPVGAQRARCGEQVWFPIPPRHPAPPHGAGWETFPVEGRSMPLSSCSQGASSAAEATPQTRMEESRVACKDETRRTAFFFGFGTELIGSQH
ncbi:hypothetical protein EAH_00044530 [Eimeria acervulina]|uniref:Uncharacterized protein n=1 Tax=Eimeria acervulina TaxID=5801 RepID=U6GM03_EIMAC|nr:hypothetical protein EAH_00044530 [Eimeria acervulina]CDI79634.1 hypothetical protein EAH_00044530 [Eimeria acervulina]